MKRKTNLGTLDAVLLIVAVLQLAPGAWAQSRYKTLHKFSGNDESMPFAVDPFFKQLAELVMTQVVNEQFLFELRAKSLFQSLNEIRDGPVALKVRFARLMQLSDIVSDVCESKIDMRLPLLRFAKRN